VKADVAVNRGGGNVAIAGVKVERGRRYFGRSRFRPGLNVEIETRGTWQLNSLWICGGCQEGPVEVRRLSR